MSELSEEELRQGLTDGSLKIVRNGGQRPYRGMQDAGTFGDVRSLRGRVKME